MKTPDDIKLGLEYVSTTNIAKKVMLAKTGKMLYAYTEEVAADALALIRQLEAKLAEYEKALAPMTLEEAKKLKGVWIEDDGCYWGDIEPTPHPALYFARVNGHLMAFVGDNYMDEEELAYFEESEYNKTWRCWSRKPTNEERKAAKWSD